MILKPPTNYTGSKHNLIDELLKYFPSKNEVSTFYDVFCGGLSVSMNVQYNNIISNDVIEPLIKFYQNLKIATDKNLIEEEINKIRSYAIDKTSQCDFNLIRKNFNETKDPYLFFSLVSSCTNNMMRFNKKGEFNQTFGKRTINENTIEKVKKYMDRMNNMNISFTNKSFNDLLSREMKPTKGDFVYLDPPYWISEAGYNATWSRESENNLYDIMDEMDSNGIKFLMSNISKHKGIITPYINRMKKWNMVDIEYNYEKVARKKDKGETKEVMIMNF